MSDWLQNFNFWSRAEAPIDDDALPEGSVHPKAGFPGLPVNDLPASVEEGRRYFYEEVLPRREEFIDEVLFIYRNTRRWRLIQSESL